MANLGDKKGTYYISKPKYIDTPDPKKAPAFEIELPSKQGIIQNVKKALSSKANR